MWDVCFWSIGPWNLEGFAELQESEPLKRKNLGKKAKVPTGFQSSFYYSANPHLYARTTITVVPSEAELDLIRKPSAGDDAATPIKVILQCLLHLNPPLPSFNYRL